MADLFTEQTFALQEYEEVPNGIGGYKEEWTDKGELSGFLDLFSGSNRNYNNQNAIVEQSTHILITDYTEAVNDKMKVVDSRGREYVITLIDDPLNIHDHLEIYLELSGVANG